MASQLLFPDVDGRSKVDLLARLTDAELRALWRIGERRDFRPRERVVEQGDAGGELFVVLSGRLRVISSSPEDKHLAEAILGPGEVFGEIAMLDARPRTASVEALDDCETLCVRGDLLMPYLERHPRVAVHLLAAVAAKMRRLCEFVDDTNFLSLPARLAKRLLELSTSYGLETRRGTRIELRLTQTELGALVGTTRESVNKQLRDWEEKEIVETDEGHLLIHRSDRLEAIACGLTG